MNNLLFYSSVTTVVLIGIHVIHHWHCRRNTIFLSVYLLALVLLGMVQSLFIEGPSALLAILFQNTAPVTFLAGPFLYFYVRGVLRDDHSLSWKDAIHFVPALMVLVNVLPYMFTSFEYKMQVIVMAKQDPAVVASLPITLFIPLKATIAARPVFICGYALWCLYSFYKFSKVSRIAQSGTRHIYITYRWLILLPVLTMILAISGFIKLFALGYYAPSFLVQSAPKVQSAILLMIPLFLLLFPELVYGIPSRKQPVSENETATPEMETSDVAEDKIAFADPSEQFSELASQIMDYLRGEKPFLDPDFSIDELSKSLSVPRHHLYYCFNSYLKTRFSAVRNQLRVAHAKELLESGITMTNTIESIGVNSGFKSRSSFYRTFKSETGLTPTEFLEHCAELVAEPVPHS